MTTAVTPPIEGRWRRKRLSDSRSAIRDVSYDQNFCWILARTFSLFPLSGWRQRRRASVIWSECNSINSITVKVYVHLKQRSLWGLRGKLPRRVSSSRVDQIRSDQIKLLCLRIVHLWPRQTSVKITYLWMRTSWQTREMCFSENKCSPS